MAIKVYGADWCSMTTSTREHLDSLGIDYEYIDVEEDKTASDWVKDHNNGKEKKPTLDIDGVVLTEPSNKQLDKTLREKGVLA